MFGVTPAHLQQPGGTGMPSMHYNQMRPGGFPGTPFMQGGYAGPGSGMETEDQGYRGAGRGGRGGRGHHSRRGGRKGSGRGSGRGGYHNNYQGGGHYQQQHNHHQQHQQQGPSSSENSSRSGGATPTSLPQTDSQNRAQDNSSKE